MLHELIVFDVMCGTICGAWVRSRFKGDVRQGTGEVVGISIVRSLERLPED